MSVIVLWYREITVYTHCSYFFLSSKDYMPFSDIYVSTFKKDIEYNQLLMQTALALQTNKFIQVRVGHRLLESINFPCS